jgi:hypothetical protein
VTAGYLDLDGAASPVSELVVLGDWNVDFQQNQSGVGATNVQRTNNDAFVALTPTLQGGSSAPPIVAGPGAVAGPGVPGPAPVPWPVSVFPAAPTRDQIPEQAMFAAVTSQGTILLDDTPANAATVTAMGVGANLALLRDSAFDLFFYGGTRLANAVMVNPPLVPPQSGQVIDVPASIVPLPAVPANGQIDVSQIQGHYAAANTYNAVMVPNLSTVGAVLTPVDRWRGANLVSDHVPVVLEFPCP